MPTWSLNKEIGLYAESLGFDYLFSMVKWRGFGGETRHWDFSLESLTLMSGLAAVTERIGIIASVQPLVLNPAVAAKMASTVDEISGGRFGMNLVTGQYFDEYAQMGILPDGYAKKRYDYAQEWIDLVKRLWTEDSVTHDGTYFQLQDCVSDPKPVQKPGPSIVCAGMSERGMEFTARNGSHSFVTGADYEQIKVTSRRSKEVARSVDTSVRTNTVLVLITADSDEEALAMVEDYREGVDVEAWGNIFNIYTKDADGASSKTVLEQAKNSVFFGFLPVAGSPRTVAEILVDLVRDGELDGLLFTFPDYLDGLRRFDEQVRPIMVELGIQF
jgi:pyrimidine oxygenase